MTLKLLNAADIGYDVVLLAGQSNMVSYGSGGIDTTYLDAPDARIAQWPGSGSYAGLGRPIAAVDPLFHHEQIANTAGLATTFAKEYLRTVPGNRKVLLVPTAHGSTGFTTSSLGSPPAGYTYVAGGGWDPTGGQGGINLYEFAIAQANAALAENPNNRIVAILWVQGESDVALSSTAYAAKLDALIAGFRSRITGATNVPFLVGQMLPERIAVTGSYATMNQTHIDTARRNLRCAFWYGATGYARTDDYNPPLHYTNEGQRRNGFRAFTALARARANVAGIAPTPPTSIALTQTGTTITAAWVSPAARVTDYKVRYSSDGGTTWTTLTRAQSIDTTATLTGLTLGATITVQAQSVNETGNSAWSTAVTLTLATLPGQVTALTAGTPTASVIPLSWTAPGTGSAPSTYLVEYKLRSSSSWTVTATVSGLSTSITGLTDTTLYDFRVTAQNAAGSGTTSTTTSATTATPAALLSDVAATAYRAYSLRRVNSSYNGNAILVRRSSDSTTQAVGFIGNNLDTASLLTFVGSGSGYIQTWYDQSGSGRDLTQATAANQARIVNAGTLDAQGGKPAAYFNGTSTVYLDTTSIGLYAAGAASMIAVVNGATAATYPNLACEIAATTSAGMWVPALINPSGKLQALAKSDAAATLVQTAGLSGAGGALGQMAVVDNGTAITAYLNGTADTAATYSSRPAITLTRFALGAQATTAFWNGYVSELVFFASALSGTALSNGRTNQKSYFGTP